MRAALAFILLAPQCAVVARGEGVEPPAVKTVHFVEWEATVGASTEQRLVAESARVRLFGETKAELRYFVEGTWGRTSGTADAFGAAYPYDGHVRLGEAYLDTGRFCRHGVLGLKLGRFRTPFGLHSREDQGYTGFLRAPLVRYGRDFAVSNYWLEGGASLTLGSPRAQVEISAGVPQEDSARRRGGIDTTVRAQAWLGPVVVGASHLRTSPERAFKWARGAASFTGVDLRWMKSGVQVRGEWITGRPFASARTTGAYVDVSIHQPALGPVTLLARADHVDYAAGKHSFARTRLVAGARVRVAPWLMVDVNGVNQLRAPTDEPRWALDVGFTVTGRR